MEAPQGGFFLPDRIAFSKPVIPLWEQLALMESRGLLIADHAAAEHALRCIGYYRLVGYALDFRASPTSESYIEGISFDDVLALVTFDREIRLLLFDAIERVEVAFRATLNNLGVAQARDPFWLCNADYFDHGQHDKVMGELENVLGKRDAGKHSHQFISSYYAKYSDPYPPSWMLMECLSFSATSRIYKLLKGRLRLEIAEAFDLQHSVLESWAHSLSHCRNVAAHHSKCWNRKFTIRPKVPKEYRGRIELPSEPRLYMQCFMLQHFLKVIADRSNWAGRLKALIEQRPEITLLEDMGFPANWTHDEIWRT